MRRLWFAALMALSCAPTLIPVAAYATVTTSTRSVTYTGSGGTTFTIPYPFSNTDWITATKTTISSGATAPLVQGVDYRVTLPVGTTNGRVTLIGAYAGGLSSSYTITIDRIVPYTQTTSFKTQGSFRPADHEAAFDKLTEEIQQLADGAALTADVDAAIAAHDGAADPHPGYLLLAGRAGGQHAKGGTAAGENLWLESTANATKGLIKLGSGGTELVVDDVNNVVGIGTAAPSASYKLDVIGAVRLGSSSSLILDNTAISESSTGSKLTVYGGTSAANGARLELRGSTFGGGPVAYLKASTLLLNNAADSFTGFQLDATNGFFFNYGGVGAMQFTSSDASMLIIDNDSTAFDIGSPGDTNLMRFDTTNGAEKVSISGNFAVSGTSTGRAPVSSTYTVLTDLGAIRYYQYNTALTAECGSVFVPADSSADEDHALVSLPLASASNKGCQFTVFDGGADGALAVGFDVSALDHIYGSCVGVTGAGAATVVQFNGTAGSHIENTYATSNKGDHATALSDGSAWWVHDCVGEWVSIP